MTEMLHMDKIGIVGLGAIGSILAADIAKQGIDVWAAVKHAKAVEHIASSGVKVRGVGGEYVVSERIHPVENIDGFPSNLDAIIIATKAEDAISTAKRSVDFIDKNGVIVTTQNGVIEEEVVKTVDPSLIAGCVISFGATMISPGVSEKTSHGEILIGPIEQKQNSSRLETINELRGLLDYTEPTRYTENIIGYKYSKLLLNSAINSLGVIGGITLGELMKRKLTRRAFLTVITEGVLVANSSKIKLEVLNKLNFYKLMLSERELFGFSFSYLKKDLLLRIIGRKYRRLKSSSLQSYERGRPTEIPYLNGHLSRKGREVGVATPLNDFIVELVEEIEMGKTQPSIENLQKVEKKTQEVWGLV